MATEPTSPESIRKQISISESPLPPSETPHMSLHIPPLLQGGIEICRRERYQRLQTNTPHFHQELLFFEQELEKIQSLFFSYRTVRQALKTSTGEQSERFKFEQKAIETELRSIISFLGEKYKNYGIDDLSFGFVFTPIEYDEFTFQKEVMINVLVNRYTATNRLGHRFAVN